MIEYLRGKLAELEPTMATVDCMGVGYGVNITLNTYVNQRFCLPKIKCATSLLKFGNQRADVSLQTLFIFDLKHFRH